MTYSHEWSRAPLRDKVAVTSLATAASSSAELFTDVFPLAAGRTEGSAALCQEPDPDRPAAMRNPVAEGRIAAGPDVSGLNDPGAGTVQRVLRRSSRHHRTIHCSDACLQRLDAARVDGQEALPV